MVCIKSIGKSLGNIDLFQILLQNLKILQSTSLERRHTFASGFSTTRWRLPARRISEADTRLCFWSSVKTFGTSLAQIFRIAKSSVIMVCTVILSMPIRSAIMRTLNRPSEFSSISRTRCTLSSVLDVDGRPARGSSSTLSRPSLKSLCHLKTAVCDMLSSLNTWRIMSNVSVPDFSSPTQNLMAYRCSIVRCILSLHRFTRQGTTKNSI